MDITHSKYHSYTREELIKEIELANKMVDEKVKKIAKDFLEPYTRYKYIKMAERAGAMKAAHEELNAEIDNTINAMERSPKYNGVASFLWWRLEDDYHRLVGETRDAVNGFCSAASKLQTLIDQCEEKIK